MTSPSSAFVTIPALCRGEQALLTRWAGEASGRESLSACTFLIALGCGLYGATIGLRHGWEMAAYVAVKLPAVVFLTLLLNAALNGMLGLVLGSGIGFRGSLQFLLTGFAIMSVILGAVSPVTFFATLNMPPPGAQGSHTWHGLNLLLHTTAIAFAGIVAHHRLLAHVRVHAQTSRAGTHTFFAWLAGNLFVGAQVSWNLRPFFVSPGLEVEFFRKHPFDGSFYEAVWRALLNVLPF